MNAFEFTKDHLLNGLKSGEGEGIDGTTYGQALMWDLLQY